MVNNLSSNSKGSLFSIVELYIFVRFILNEFNGRSTEIFFSKVNLQLLSIKSFLIAKFQYEIKYPTGSYTSILV